MKNANKILSAIALLSAITLSGCALPPENEEIVLPPEETEEYSPEQPSETQTEEEKTEEQEKNQQPPAVDVPKIRTVAYIKVTSDGVNIRKGASTSSTALGTAEKNTLYACSGESGKWYKTYYKNTVAYIYKEYCIVVEMEEADEKVEKTISEGAKCLGVKYVYGATRYHDGNGNLLSGFTTSAFDCSSLMQYIFKKGASLNLQVNTRTQIYQGKTVSRSQLKRGDLIFFTNASRKNNKGIERVGHVALYLGGNYILHTASDYAKIEQISSTRWGYYIQAQRMI